MIWPFSASRSPLQSTIEAIYGAIVAQARNPVFYRDFGVPDTVDGRFDMVVLHMWLVLRERPSSGDELARGLVDRFCTDMDDNLRELGVGDLTVPKRMMKFGEAFYGRAQAYDAAILPDAPQEALGASLNKNIYGGKGGSGVLGLTSYTRSAARQVASQATDLDRGVVRFPEPSVMAQE